VLIKKLLSQISSLEERLIRYENPKNSRTSSILPSHDYSRPLRTKSLRESSDKKPGEQPSHGGITLVMGEKPDKIVEHIPQYSTCFSRDISHFQIEFVERHQEIVLPEIKPIVIVHQVFRRTFICGNKSVGDFPSGITPSISYGENVETLAAYLNMRQLHPFHRLAELFRDMFFLPISEGSLVKSINRIAEKAVPAYELIRERVTTARVDGGGIIQYYFNNFVDTYPTYVGFSSTLREIT
jgi:hypothetical protein